MGLRDYWRAFKRRAWIPILLVAVTIVTVGVFAYLAKPTYTGTALIVATGGTLDTGNGQAQTFSFQQIATSNTVAINVSRKLVLNQPPDQLANRIHVVSSGANLYRLSISDASPERAATLANALAQEAVTQYQQLGNQLVVTSVDTKLGQMRDTLRQEYVTAATARLQFQAAHPKAFAANATLGGVALAAQGQELLLEEDAAATAFRNILQLIKRQELDRVTQLGIYAASVIDQAVAKPETGGRAAVVGYAAGLALLAGVALVFLLEYLDKSVREPEVAEELVGAPVIGVIPRATARSLGAVKARRS